MHVFGVLGYDVIIRSHTTAQIFTNKWFATEGLFPHRQPFIVEVWHHVNFPIPASRLSKTRVYGYLLVIRPVCGNTISQAVQHVSNVVLLASGPLRKPAADVTQWLQLVLLSPAIRHPPFSAEPCAWHSHCSRQAVATVYLPCSCTHWALSWSRSPHAHKAEVVAYLPGWRRGHHEHRNRKVIGAFYPNKQVVHTGGWSYGIVSVRFMLLMSPLTTRQWNRKRPQWVTLWRVQLWHSCNSSQLIHESSLYHQEKKIQPKLLSKTEQCA